MAEAEPGKIGVPLEAVLRTIREDSSLLEIQKEELAGRISGIEDNELNADINRRIESRKGNIIRDSVDAVLRGLHGIYFTQLRPSEQRKVTQELQGSFEHFDPVNTFHPHEQPTNDPTS